VVHDLRNPSLRSGQVLVGSCHHCLSRAEAALEAAVECPEGAIRPDDRSRGLSESLPTMSQSDFPEHFPFALNASFLPCAPGLVHPLSGKIPENIPFSLNSACFDLALGCILWLTRLVLVRKDFAQGALKYKLLRSLKKTA
jgi:hypothetical protein